MSSFAKKLSIYLKSYWKWVKPEENPEICTNISADKAKEFYAANKDKYTWLDVRTEMEYERGHIPEAKLIPIDQLKDRLSEVGKKEKPTIVFCHSGGRSAVACEILSKDGHKKLYHMHEGMSQWTGPKES